jgi:hypothetical protein
MDFKAAIVKSTDSIQCIQPKTTLTMDTALAEINAYMHRQKLKAESFDRSDKLNEHLNDIIANDGISDLYEELSEYWNTFGHLNHSSYTSFCEMLRSVFNVNIYYCQDDE